MHQLHLMCLHYLIHIASQLYFALFKTPINKCTYEPAYQQLAIQLTIDVVCFKRCALPSGEVWLCPCITRGLTLQIMSSITIGKGQGLACYAHFYLRIMQCCSAQNFDLLCSKIRIVHMLSLLYTSYIFIIQLVSA